MTYQEVVDKIKSHTKFFATEVTAEQMFRLYIDRHIRYLNYHNNEYEINLISLDPNEHHIYELVKEDDSYNTFENLLLTFINNTENHKRSFVIIDHQEYEVVVELMVSNE